MHCTTSRAPFAFCIFRGFSPNDHGELQLIIRHKRVRGTWVYGNYYCNRQTDEHYIRADDGTDYIVVPDTIGMQEPNSLRWPGDTCFFDGVRGVVRFGRHYDPTTYNREEVHYYIDWLGDELKKNTWRSDLLFWAQKAARELIWSGTIWDPVSEYRHLVSA